MWLTGEGALPGIDPLARLVALPRLGAQRGVLAAVLLSIVLATTLLATGPVLATAIAEGGLRASLEQTPPSELGIEIEARTTAAGAPAVAEALRAAVVAQLGARVAEPDILITMGTVTLADQPTNVVVPIAFWEGITDRDLLQSVAAIDESQRENAVRVLAHVDTLVALGVEVGDVVRVERGPLLQIVEAVQPRDPADRRWWDDPYGRDGVIPGVDFTQVGPLYLNIPGDQSIVFGVDDPRAVVQLRTLPVLDEVGPGTLGELGALVRGLDRRIDAALGDGLADRWTVQAPLAEATDASTFALAATRASVVAAIGQIAVLALYTLGLAGRLLRSGRDVETMLARARGATPRQLGTAALVEGLLLVVPAVLIAPWLAVRTTVLLGRLGVVTSASLTFVPQASLGSLAAATIAGVACLGVLVVPAVTSARRTYATARGARGRRSPVTVVQSLGLDLALVAVAAVGVWQLRTAEGPLGGVRPQDAGDVDLILVAAPALGLLAGALLVLRIVPALARGGEVLAERRRGVVAGLSGWQVARRPDAISRPTLLLVLAVAVGVLASTYGATWSRSQDDQADAAVGADLVVEPDRRVGALADERTATTLTAVEGVNRAVPAWEAPVSLVASAPGGTALAYTIDEPMLRTRQDTEPTVPYLELDVPRLTGLPLPAGATLTLPSVLAADARWPAFSIDLTVVIRDGQGLLHRLPHQQLSATGKRTPLAWPLTGVVGPVELIAVESIVEAGNLDGTGFVSPDGTANPSAVTPAPPRIDLQIAAPVVDGAVVVIGDVAWVHDPFTSFAAFPPSLREVEVEDTGWRFTGTAGLAGPRGRLSDLRIVAATAALPQESAVPALVDAGVLEATGRAVGDDLALVVGGAPMRLVIIGTAPLVPGAVDERSPLVVDIDAVTAARWTNGRATTRPTRWQLELDDDGLDATARVAHGRRIAAVLSGGEVSARSTQSLAIDASERRRDPIAVGLLVALTLGALAAVALALLGTVASATVGVRERAAEFALLQAIGTSVRQLRWWLAAEIVVVVTTGLLAGGLLGAALVWAVLPTIALAADGSVAVPAPQVVVPWGTLGLTVAVVVAAFASVPLVLSRVVARAHIAEVLRLGEDG